MNNVIFHSLEKEISTATCFVHRSTLSNHLRDISTTKHLFWEQIGNIVFLIFS